MANQLDLGALTSARVPPSWGPEKDREYSFRTYSTDLLIWQAATDVDALRQGPTAMLRLTGAAKNLAREIPIDTLINGQQRHDPNGVPMFDVQGFPIMMDGVEALLHILRRRYGMLPQEVQISAISAIMNFRMHNHEDVDQCLARLDVAFFKSEMDGGAQFLPPIKAWMTLSILRIPAEKWTVLLAPTEGRLPVNDVELSAFNMYLRRHGHLQRHGSTDVNKSITQHFFMDETQQPQETTRSWDQSSAIQPTNMSGYPIFGQDTHGSEAPDEDFMSVSSAESLESADVDWTDCANDSSTPNVIGESLYLAYRHAKRKWRSFAGPKRKRFFRKPRDVQPHASKTVIKKKYRTLPKPFFVESGYSYFGAPQAHPKGGGKRPFVRSGNPYDAQGKQLECSICNSKDHFRANCPQNHNKSHAHHAMLTGVVAVRIPQPASTLAGFTGQPASSASSASNMHSMSSSSGASNASTVVRQTLGNFFVSSNSASHADFMPKRVMNQISFADGSASQPIATADDPPNASAVPMPKQVQSHAQPKAKSLPLISPQVSISDQQAQAKARFAFPAWHSTYHAQVRLHGTEALTIDTGAVFSLTGSEWVSRVEKLCKQNHQSIQTQPLTKQISVEGVGNGASHCSTSVTVPTAYEGNMSGTYTAPIIPDSPIPALLGLQPMTDNRMLIDTINNRAYLVGEGGYDIHLSPGSVALKLRRSETGHLMLPCAEWAKHKPSTEERHVTFIAEEVESTCKHQNSQDCIESKHSNFFLMADERRQVLLPQAIPFTEDNCKTVDVARPIWLAADGEGLSRKQTSQLAHRIMAFASKCKHIVVDAGTSLARRLKLKSLKPLIVTLALLSVLCLPQHCSGESPPMLANACDLTISTDPMHAIEVMTNMAFSHIGTGIVSSEALVTMNHSMWVQQNDAAQLNLMQHVYNSVIQKTASVSSLSSLPNATVIAKKIRKKNVPHRDEQTQEHNLGEHADMLALSKDEQFFDCSDKTPANDDCGDNTAPILLSICEHHLFSDSDNDMSDLEFEECISHETDVFDSAFYNHHCSTIPNNHAQFYADALHCFHALRSQHNTRSQVDIVELFGGKDGIAKVAVRRNMSIGKNWDLETGCDLTDPKHVQAFCIYITECKPFIILCGPPCTAMGGWSRLNRVKHPETWLPKREIGEQLADLTAWACLEQIKHSRHFIVENPYPSDLWHLTCWQPLQAFPIVFQVFDQCMYGLTDPAGIATKKTTGLLASHQQLVSSFNLRCDDQHIHAALEGSVNGINRCRYAQTWPRKMLELIVKGIKHCMQLHEAIYNVLHSFPIAAPSDCPGCRAHAVRSDMRHNRVAGQCRFPQDSGIEWGCPACRRNLPSTHQGHNLQQDCQWSIARRRVRGGVRAPAEEAAEPAAADAPAPPPEPLPAVLRNPRRLEAIRPEGEELTIEPPPNVGTLQWQPVTDPDILESMTMHAQTDGWKFIRGQQWCVQTGGRELRTSEPRHSSIEWNLRSTYGMFPESQHADGHWWRLEFQADYTAPLYPYTRARFGYTCPVLVQVFTLEHKIIPEMAPILAPGAASSSSGSGGPSAAQPVAPIALQPADADDEPPPQIEHQQEVEINPEWSSFDMGTALRALKSTNERVVLRALRRLHVRWYHCGSSKMQSLLLAAGVSKETVKLVTVVVDTCRICRSWKRPSANNATTASLSTRFNEKLELDLLFYKTWIILHIICCATRFSMTSILADRTTETILTAITQCWFRLFGAPNEIVTDQEGAMTSEAAMAWSEHWHCALKFVPKGSHAHVVERHHEILRDCLHKIEDQCKTEGIAVNKEHILSEATFAKNAFVQIQGQSPYTAVLGRIPNLLLELEGNSSSAVIDSAGNIQGVNRHVTRLREIALQAIIEGTARSRLQIAERTKSRPSAAMSGAQLGQMVEIWRQPTTKDLVGWRGPCRIVSLNQIEHGLIEVEWQGRTMSCRLSDVRASTLLVLLISEPVGTPWQVVVSFLKGFHSGHVTCAWVFTDHGWQMSKVAAEQPLLLKSLLHTARFELGLTQCIGARLGRQICQLPGMFGVELSLLLWWPTKSIHDYRSWEHPGHQTIDIKHIIRGANEHDISWVQFMCTEHSHIKELRQANMQLEPWWWNRPNGNHPGHGGHDSESDGGDELGPLPSEAHMQSSQDNDSSQSLPSTRHGSPVKSMNRYMSDDDASMPSTVKYQSPMPSTVKYAPSTTSSVQKHETHQDQRDKRPLSTNNSGPESMQYRRLNPLEKRPLSTNNSGRNPHTQRKMNSDATSSTQVPANSTAPVENPGIQLPLDSSIAKDHDSNHDYSSHESETEDYADDNGFFVGTAVPIVKDLDELTPAEVKSHWNAVSSGITKELMAFNDLKSFAPHPRSECSNLMSARWLFKWKMVDGIRTVKARLTLRGFQDKSGGSIATFAGTATRWSQRVVCSYAVLMGWTILTWDVSNAFLRGMSFDELAQLTGDAKREVQFDVLPAYRHFFDALPILKGMRWESHALKCLKAIYGLKDAPRAWRLKIHQVFIKLGAIQLAVDRCLYIWQEGGETVLVGSVHVDDIKTAGTAKMVSWVKSMLEEVLGALKEEVGTFEHLGIKHEQDGTSKEIRTHQNHYSQKLHPIDTKALDLTNEQLALDSTHTALYLTLLGALSWLCQTRLDICVYVQSLQRSSACPNVGCLVRLNRVCNWVRRKTFVLTYRRFNITSVRLMAVSDAAFRREDITGLSLRGHIIMLTENHAGHPGGMMHPIEWSCRKQKRIVRSTYGAELHSVSDAVETALVIRSVYAQLFATKLLNALELANCIAPPLQAAIDCRSVFDSLASEETKRPSEESLIFTLLQLKELLRHKRLQRLWWTTTGDMLADCMNKGVISRQYLFKAIHSGTWELLNDTVFHEEIHSSSIT